MAPAFVKKIWKTVQGVFVFILKSTVGYMPMMLLRVISRKINERTAVMSAQHQREYAQQLASRMRGGPRPQQPVGTHYQPPYYYNEPAYGREIYSGLDITYE
ncbi:uncharacterized protein LOC129002013 [Macrosteles quadrilineatus]|uniref:uncharacterized protein LOC129002013 n=1 Tax=Macrosteles quadrilineatus TaxID=74068 RepID=UPI0023E25EAF|nr:uncharacterized protein LOC129002013 [Macrosteles quadrilineatus]